jgi:hypothetical protein
MSITRRVVVSVTLLSGIGACSNPAADGGFGEAKPVKDDGMIGKAQPVPEAPPDWASALAIEPSYDGATKTLKVLLRIKPGFHAYGPGEEVSKPVGFSVKEGSSWRVDGAVTIPAGVKKDLGTLGTSVIVEGDVAITATLVPGTGPIEGVVEAQVCTDTACDRPRKHPITVAVGS